MKNTVWRRCPALFSGLLFLILALVFVVKLPFLVVADLDNKPVIFIPLTGKKEFSLYYTHSVQKTPVQENFTLGQGSDLLLISTEFQSLGVGTPFLPGEGQLINREGKFILTGLNRHFEEIDLGALPIAGHALLYKNKKFVLNEYFSPDALVRIRVIRCSTAFMLWQSIVL